MLMKKILNVSEMKQVRGGGVVSSLCAPDEYLYSCTTSFGNGASSNGKVCAKNNFVASEKILNNYRRMAPEMVELGILADCR
ncbi:hypothetical protein DW036_09550 [Bacteroides sp. AF39-11AC]|jgi:hypothetical protein|nr:hypothetical protein DW036_09550 [Bacteroides sp. AF39-11AC]